MLTSSFLHYSGVISIVIVWTILIGYPFLHRDLGFAKETISALGEKKRNVFTAVTIALLTGNACQIVFLVYLQRKYSLGFDSYGMILYATMCVLTLFATLFTPKSFPKTHRVSAASYLVVLPLTILIIGYDLATHNSTLFYLALTLSALYILITLYMLKKYKTGNALIEVFCFFILSVWTVALTLY